MSRNRAAGNARVRRVSAPQASEFSRSRLFVGILVVGLIGAGVAFVLAQSRGGPKAGRVIYATPGGVYSHDLESGEDRRVATLPKGTAAALPSPDGKWIAYSKGAGEVWLTELGGDTQYQIGERFVLPLGWSPDSKFVASELLSDKDLVLIDPEGGKRTVIGSGTFPGISVPVWIDEHRFAIATSPAEFVVVDSQKKDRSGTFAGTPLAASPDGAELLIAREGGVLVTKVESDEPVGLRVIFEGDAVTAASSPQGFLAVAAKDKDGHNGAWIFEGGYEARQVVEGKVNWLGWSRAGAALIYERKGAIYALERPGAEPKRVSRPGAEVFPVSSFTVVP